MRVTLVAVVVAAAAAAAAAAVVAWEQVRRGRFVDGSR